MLRWSTKPRLSISVAVSQRTVMVPSPGVAVKETRVTTAAGWALLVSVASRMRAVIA